MIFILSKIKLNDIVAEEIFTQNILLRNVQVVGKS